MIKKHDAHAHLDAKWNWETEPIPFQYPAYSRPIGRPSLGEAKVADTPAIWEVIVVDKARMKVLESKMVVALNRDQALIKADVHRHFLVEENFKNYTIVTRMIETIC
jgi:hypothetical protein